MLKEWHNQAINQSNLKKDNMPKYQCFCFGTNVCRVIIHIKICESRIYKI